MSFSISCSFLFTSSNCRVHLGRGVCSRNLVRCAVEPADLGVTSGLSGLDCLVFVTIMWWQHSPETRASNSSESSCTDTRDSLLDSTLLYKLFVCVYCYWSFVGMICGHVCVCVCLSVCVCVWVVWESKGGESAGSWVALRTLMNTHKLHPHPRAHSLSQIHKTDRHFQTHTKQPWMKAHYCTLIQRSCCHHMIWQLCFPGICNSGEWLPRTSCVLF